MAKTDLSIRKFMADMKSAEDKAQLVVMRFQLQLGMLIQATAQENIKDTFGKGRGGAKADITNRGYGTTARRSGRGGALFRSVNLEADPRFGVKVTAGGPGAPYAVIHELGGTIRPRIAKFLTLPFQPQFAGTRAREHKLYFDVDPVWGRVLRMDTGFNNRKTEDSIAFLLRRSVTIPARPYFKPAVDAVTKQPSVRQLMRQILNRETFDMVLK